MGGPAEAASRAARQAGRGLGPASRRRYTQEREETMARPGDGGGRGAQEIEGFERIFNVVGWLGFVAILPIALDVFGIDALQKLADQHLGRWGSKGFLLLVFFGLVLARVIFGSGRIIAPLLLGSAVGFVLIAVAAGVPFMSWLGDLAEASPFFSNMPLNFLVGLAVVFLGILMSAARRIPVVIQVLLLVVLPIAAIVAAGATGFASGLRALGG
jgi:hypothetical protein